MDHGTNSYHFDNLLHECSLLIYPFFDALENTLLGIKSIVDTALPYMNGRGSEPL